MRAAYSVSASLPASRGRSTDGMPVLHAVDCCFPTNVVRPVLAGSPQRRLTLITQYYLPVDGTHITSVEFTLGDMIKPPTPWLRPSTSCPCEMKRFAGSGSTPARLEQADHLLVGGHLLALQGEH